MRNKGDKERLKLKGWIENSNPRLEILAKHVSDTVKPLNIIYKSVDFKKHDGMMTTVQNSVTFAIQNYTWDKPNLYLNTLN